MTLMYVSAYAHRLYGQRSVRSKKPRITRNFNFSKVRPKTPAGKSLAEKEGDLGGEFSPESEHRLQRSFLGRCEEGKAFNDIEMHACNYNRQQEFLNLSPIIS